MASSSYFEDSSNELTCAICLHLFEEPVSLPCGHSFCSSCLENYWESREESTACLCPNCREVFPQKPKLQKNVILARLVEQMKLREGEGSSFTSLDLVYKKKKRKKKKKVVSVGDQAEGKDGEGDVTVNRRVNVGGRESHCEVCNEEAAMRCVPYETVCCERHVKPPKHKGHNLVEPEMKVEDPGCTEHGNSIHFYCKDDESLVSLLCKAEHQDHEVVPVEVALAEFKGILAAKYPPLVESIKQVGSQIQQVHQEVRDTQVSGREKEERLEGERREMYRAVDEKVNHMKRWLSERQSVKLSHLEHQRENLQQEMDSLCEEESTLKASLKELEAVSFLEVYKDLLCRLESRSHFSTTEPAPPRLLDFPVEEQNVDSLIQINDNLLKEIQNGRTPSLDPNSAHRLIKISRDLRTATRTKTDNQYPEHPDRFDFYPQVLSSDCFSSGRHYWEVEVRSSSLWGIGICLNSMGRKGGGEECWLGRNPESLCLEKYENKYYTWQNHQINLLSVPGDAERFGFLLDCEEGEFTCFRDSRVLHVFRGNFLVPVKPAILVYNVGVSVRFCSF
uniref:E3 ubiquitin/ISG15 ligase TRIM25-like isoform X2 n=1 Tax=Myxine glutinosa TaxID=7769 RepID=UPI00358E2B3F